MSNDELAELRKLVDVKRNEQLIERIQQILDKKHALEQQKLALEARLESLKKSKLETIIEKEFEVKSNSINPVTVIGYIVILVLMILFFLYFVSKHLN